MKIENIDTDWASAQSYCESYSVRVSIVIRYSKLYIGVLSKRTRRKSTEHLASNESNVIIDNNIWLQTIDESNKWPLGIVSKDLEQKLKSKWIEIALKIKEKQDRNTSAKDAA